ncbi:MAG: patatin-like phospholipase family protein [Gemmatimonadota bacterium]
MSGGGSRGAFQLGAVQHLVAGKGLDFQVVAGVSAGSLNAAMLAQGVGPDGLREQLVKLKRLWFGIDTYEDIYRKRFLGEVGAFLWSDSLYSSEPLREKIRREVSGDALRRSGRELRVGAVVLESGAYRTVTQDDDELREWTLASSSMPLFFPPVKVGGETAVDGGVRNVTPLADAFKALKALPPSADGDAADGLYVLLASPFGVDEERRPWKTGLDVARRATSILVDEVFREDLSYALAINRSVRAYEAIKRTLETHVPPEEADALLKAFPYRPPRYRYVRMHTIVPHKSFSELLEFDPRKIREAFEAGQQAAQSPLTEEELERRLEESSAGKA